jgi:dephospho-CoA kinase
LREIEARQREKQGKQQMINENNRKIEELQQEIDRLNAEY